MPFCSVSLIKEENSTYDGETHPLLEVCRERMGHDGPLLSGKLNETSCQLPGKTGGVETKGDVGGMLSADLTPS